MANEPRSISSSEFRAKCFAVLNEVRETRQEIVITKEGKPVARLVPFERPLIPDLRHMFAFPLGDIESPIDVVWEAELGILSPDDRPLP